MGMGLGSARLGGNGVLVCPGVKHLIRFSNQLGSSSLCLCRVRAKIISAGISWKEGRKEGRREGKNCNFVL